MNKNRIEVIPLRNFPIVQIGDDLPSLISSVTHENDFEIHKGDIVVVTHTIVSITEGDMYQLDEVKVSDRASKIAERTGHPPERVEVALREATKIFIEEPVLITKTKHGIITDFSGVDESNAPLGSLVAMPNQPDESAKRISESLSAEMGFPIPVIITDTQGRPWRKGAVNLAIGVAGMSPFTHNAGKEDIYGHQLRGSLVCLADQIACSAELVMGQADEGVPVVIIRGVDSVLGDGSASDIIRSESENLFG
jgi:coenzyme F420-0:L-glutamate ligase/coenzyme F420-1:gamma-L-glutamate ligase